MDRLISTYILAQTDSQEQAEAAIQDIVKGNQKKKRKKQQQSTLANIQPTKRKDESQFDMGIAEGNQTGKL